MLEAIQLCKNFGVVTAALDVSFRVELGEAVGFLGPNGAGKTTTFRMMAGTLSPDSGSVRIMGHDLQKAPIAAKRALGYMPENAAMYPEMTVDEYLRHRCHLKGIPRPRARVTIDESLSKAGAAQMRGVAIGHLSKGFRQRTALADALLGNPPVLLLDEPTSGLDPNQVLAFRELIRELRKEHALILSTHVLSEVEATCGRAVVIHQGRVLAEGALSDLRAARSGDDLHLLVRGRSSADAPTAERLESPHARVEAAPENVGSYHIVIPSPDDVEVERLVKRCVDAGWGVLEVSRQTTPLDAVFSQLTQEAEGPR